MNSALKGIKVLPFNSAARSQRALLGKAAFARPIRTASTLSTFSASSMTHPSTMAVDTSSATATNSAALDSHNDNASISSLPDSPTTILAGTKSAARTAAPTAYVAPPIPQSFRDSLQAYFKKTNSAAPELFLYRHSGYFTGATLNNAPNADLYTAFKFAHRSIGAGKAAQSEQDAKAQLQAALRDQKTTSNSDRTDEKACATIGTQLAEDGKVGSIRMVDIGSQPSTGITSWFSGQTQRMINMLEIGTPRPVDEIRADAQEEKIVLLHGYGAGTSFFFQNLKALAHHPQSRLYALDWLGMGRSSRVPFHITSKQVKTTETRVAAAESFFVQALEDWRAKMGLEKMTLVGHSLGGYLSLAYSLKYPQHVSRLVLVSPAGIPEAPAEYRAKQPAERKGAENIAAEVQQSQEDVAPQSHAQEERDEQSVQRTATLAKQQSRQDSTSTANAETAQTEQVKPPPRISNRRRELIQFLWEQNLSPFAILRTSFVFAPMLAGSYTRRRFASLPDDDLRALHAYCYDIFSGKGSSEYCLAHLLAPFGFARLPMVDRVGALPKSLPVAFVYGERGIDWMDEAGGRESVKRLAAAGNPHARCFAVPHSGHHVYLDNPRAFDAVLSKILRGQADDAGKAGTRVE